jgi:hypothetical protein
VTRMGECGHRGLCEPPRGRGMPRAGLSRRGSKGPAMKPVVSMPWDWIPYGILDLQWHSVDKGGPLGYNTSAVSLALACVLDTQPGSRRRDDCRHGACHGGLCGATIPWAAVRPPLVGWPGWRPVPLRPGVLFPQDCRSRRGPRAVVWSGARVVWRVRPRFAQPGLRPGWGSVRNCRVPCGAKRRC